MLSALREMGVSEQGVQIERDGWILLAALSPEVVPEWTRQRRAALADPEVPAHLPGLRRSPRLGPGRPATEATG